jgi:hypothetical protein
LIKIVHQKDQVQFTKREMSQVLEGIEAAFQVGRREGSVRRMTGTGMGWGE